MILQQIEANPETNGLKRLLAVKKSFAEFEQKVEHYAKILRNILADDEDMTRYKVHSNDRSNTIQFYFYTRILIGMTKKYLGFQFLNVATSCDL